MGSSRDGAVMDDFDSRSGTRPSVRLSPDDGNPLLHAASSAGARVTARRASLTSTLDDLQVGACRVPTRIALPRATTLAAPPARVRDRGRLAVDQPPLLLVVGLLSGRPGPGCSAVGELVPGSVPRRRPRPPRPSRPTRSPCRGLRSPAPTPSRSDLEGVSGLGEAGQQLGGEVRLDRCRAAPRPPKDRALRARHSSGYPPSSVDAPRPRRNADHHPPAHVTDFPGALSAPCRSRRGARLRFP